MNDGEPGAIRICCCSVTCVRSKVISSNETEYKDIDCSYKLSTMYGGPR